jgi:hypothetical protein
VTAPPPTPDRDRRPLARPFPPAGLRVEHAYRELHLAATGTLQQIAALGDLTRLPRPWDPPTCTQPDLRAELWHWLDDVADWVNTEYVWDVTDTIPACWPAHPHLVHEIAVLADQRRTAARALTSDPLEDWHRSTLPGFLDRMRRRLHTQCDDTHQPWPARSRHTRHTTTRPDRNRHYDADTQRSRPPQPPRGGPHLAVVDLDTGELNPPHP